MPTKKTTKKVAKKATKKTTNNEPKGYELRVKVNDVEYKGNGSTITEALVNFIDSPDFPFGSKTSSVFVIKKDKEEQSLMLSATRTRRLLIQLSQKGTAIEVFAATLERRLTS